MIDSNKLIEICQEIGTVPESNSLFTEGLTRLIGDRNILEMSVGELLEIIQEYKGIFNRIHGGMS